jgi:hypothetical protein
MTLLRMKRNSEPFSRLVIQVDDVEATQTLRTVQLDFFRLQLIEELCRQPARLHAASWSILITSTNHSEQDMFTVVVGGGFDGRKVLSPASANMWVTNAVTGVD